MDDDKQFILVDGIPPESKGLGIPKSETYNTESNELAEMNAKLNALLMANGIDPSSIS